MLGGLLTSGFVVWYWFKRDYFGNINKIRENMEIARMTPAEPPISPNTQVTSPSTQNDKPK